MNNKPKRKKLKVGPNLRAFSADSWQLRPRQRMAHVSAVLQVLLKRNLLVPKGKALDIGTGFGYGAIALSKIGLEVHGFDICKGRLNEGLSKIVGAENGIKSAQKVRVNNKLYFSASRSGRVQEKDNSFDIAFSFYTSPYIFESKNLAEYSRLIKPGGKLVVTTDIDLDNTVTRLANANWGKFTVEHVLSIKGVRDKTVIIFQNKK